jgi:hypothetical protein
MSTDLPDLDPAALEAEARERWGHTDAWRESQRRTRAYGAEQWQQARAEQEATVATFAALLAAGTPPDAPEARAAALDHRATIDRWFYPCPPELHVGLAELYVTDARFTAYYDRHAEGLAGYVHDAILAAAAADPGAGATAG